MKTKKILSALMLILFALFVVQCEKGGNRPPGAGAGDPDSDRPPWAGGGDGVNPNKNTNPSPGISKGGDYGDLYVLLRNLDGMPTMDQISVEDELIWVVQPVDAEGYLIPYNEEGELSDPTLAIPVDFGRLNTVRSPESKLEMAFVEAMKVLKAPGAVITLDFCGRLTSTYPDLSTSDPDDVIVKTIDAPRENMAIYKEIMQNLSLGRLAFLGEDPYNFDLLTVAASCFAAGSDKTGTVNVDEVVYINTFMGCDGLFPLDNEHEFDSQGQVRTYFDFSTCCDGYPFQYNRDAYKNRYIQNTRFFPVDENGYSGGPVESIWTMMEGGLFTEEWPANTPYVTHAKGFAMDIDDAVQVLELIHGDTNLRSTDIDGNPL